MYIYRLTVQLDLIFNFLCIVCFPHSDCDCLEEVVTIAAMLSTDNIWVVPDTRQKEATAAFHTARMTLSHPFGDLHTYLHVYNTYIKEGRSQEWCARNYLRYWSLVAAERMR